MKDIKGTFLPGQNSYEDAYPKSVARSFINKDSIDKKQILENFVKELIMKQQDIPVEFAKVLNDNFQKLF